MCCCAESLSPRRITPPLLSLSVCVCVFVVVNTTAFVILRSKVLFAAFRDPRLTFKKLFFSLFRLPVSFAPQCFTCCSAKCTCIASCLVSQPNHHGHNRQQYTRLLTLTTTTTTLALRLRPSFSAVLCCALLHISTLDISGTPTNRQHKP